ncbi:MAG: HAD family phosphatase [Planctomycetales bacterium]|nr:HAD family phosphatase [Planctomycetales bacterium]
MNLRLNRTGFPGFAFFDLGNVLVSFDHQTCIDQLSKVTGAEAESIRKALFDSGLQDRYETGQVECRQFAEQLRGDLKCESTDAEIIEAVSAIFTPKLDILPILQRLKAESVPMAILSNTCRGHWEWILQQNWPVISGWFSHCVLSYEIRSMKPAIEIYEACERLAACPPEWIFFTDDREENVRTAAERGWQVHLFRTATELQPDLDNWLNKVSTFN